MPDLTVSQLTIYPLKSARGIQLNTMQLAARGPEFDRRWMLVDKHGKFITQRKYSKMCLINTALNDDGLTLTVDGKPPCKVPFGQGDAIASEVWGTPVFGEDCGDQAAQWLSDLLGIQCRIIYMPENMQRFVDKDYAPNQDLVGFADGFPLLISTDASLADFNSKLDSPIGIERFRPNIVISGSDPYAEDTWQEILVAGITLSLVKPCSRCIMPSVDPQTGLKQMAINDALLAHRRRNRETYFGQNAIYNKFGEIRLHDDIIVLR